MDMEHRTAKSCYFITLTYDPDNLPFRDDPTYFRGSTIQKRQKDLIIMGHPPTLLKDDLRRFLDAFRRFNNQHEEDIQFTPQGRIWLRNKPDFKYFAIGEYGPETNRPHYHLITFNFHPETLRNLDNIWKKGHTSFSPGKGSRMAYVAKYLIDKNEQDEKSDKHPIFRVLSKGLGKTYLERAGTYHRENLVTTYTTQDGYVYPLPMYFKERLFTEAQREEIREKAVHKSDDQYFKRIETGIKYNTNPFTLMELEDEVQNRKIYQSKKRKQL